MNEQTSELLLDGAQSVCNDVERQALIGVRRYCVGVQKGDRVAVYMPMILEIVVTLLACARLGVIHSVVVSKFTLLTDKCLANVL